MCEVYPPERGRRGRKGGPGHPLHFSQHSGHREETPNKSAVGPEMDPSQMTAITCKVFRNGHAAEGKKEDTKAKMRASPRWPVTARWDPGNRGEGRKTSRPPPRVRVRRPGSQGQTDAPITVSRRGTGRGTALTDPSEGRPGTRPASKCPWKTRTDGAEGLPQRVQDARPPSPRRSPRLPWKSKGEPTDFLLDTGNRFLHVDRQKQAHRLAGVTTQKEERKRRKGNGSRSL